MSDVQSEQDQYRAEDLLPLVYDELRRLAAHKMASERPDLTIQATALVHEAYLRLTRHAAPPHWADRGKFMAAFAEAMRRVLIDSARRRGAAKRRGHGDRQATGTEAAGDRTRDDLLALDDALSRLAQVDPQKADVVRLRYFAGMTIDETAETLGISPRSADRAWAYARAWLIREIGGPSMQSS